MNWYPVRCGKVDTPFVDQRPNNLQYVALFVQSPVRVIKLGHMSFSFWLKEHHGYPVIYVSKFLHFVGGILYEQSHAISSSRCQ